MPKSWSWPPTSTRSTWTGRLHASAGCRGSQPRSWPVTTSQPDPWARRSPPQSVSPPGLAGEPRSATCSTSPTWCAARRGQTWSLRLPASRSPRRETRMNDLGVHSEVGRLRKVIVHRPDLSLERLTPANHDELLFDDVLWVERARWEHDQFVGMMRQRGVEVLYLQDLLAQTLLSSPAARLQLIEAVIDHFTVGPALVDDVRGMLAQLSPDVLARHLIVGLTNGELDADLRRLKQQSAIAAALDDDDQFVLPPLPNSLFMRDSSAWIYGGVSVNPMFWQARRRESLNVLTIYRHHPMFQEPGWRLWYPQADR